jgi:biofilm protein TabA
MVLDRLASASRYADLSPILGRALRYLTATDWSVHPLGRHALEGDDLVAIVSEYYTQGTDMVPWEAHRRYVDVQYVHAGIERIGYAPLSTLEAGVYDGQRDLVSATGEGGWVTLPAGSFAILGPTKRTVPGLPSTGPSG